MINNPNVNFSRASKASYWDKDGILRDADIDEPRSSYDPVTGESLGLLVEKQVPNQAPDIVTIPTNSFDYNTDRGTLVVTSATPKGELVAKLGNVEIYSDSNEAKMHIASYDTVNSATELELGVGTFKSIQYYDRVISSEHLSNSTAKDWAVKMDGSVEDGLYSSKFYATKFAESMNEESVVAEIHYNYLTGVTTNINSGPIGVHTKMRRCLVLDDGTVNYYLDEYDSNLKEDGSPADLSGADGQVMVETPRFWCSVKTIGVLLKIKVSLLPLPELILHPAFKSGDKEHSNIYVGAYNATVLSTALNSIIRGLNLDNNTSRVDLTVDKLCSLSGGDNYAMVGLHLAEFRSLARNRGEGWQVWDYNTWQAIQILGYTELGTFNGQEALGNGNVSKSYPASSDNQEDSPHTLNGASNHLGNGSGATNDFMTYRGIENLWGHCWQWADGVLFNNYQTYVCNDPENYSSTLTSDYNPVGELFEYFPSGEYITEFQEISDSVLLIPKTGGGNSGQFVGDVFWNSSGLRGARVGGRALNGARCGFAALGASSAPSDRSRDLGCRIMYKK